MTEERITDPTTGGQKGQKLERYDLIPWGYATDEIARVYGFGATKYSPDNWRRGYSWRLSIGAMFRHLALWVSGEELDKESRCHHLAHVAWHCLTLMTFGKDGLGTDDRPRSTPPVTELCGDEWESLTAKSWMMCGNPAGHAGAHGCGPYYWHNDNPGRLDNRPEPVSTEELPEVPNLCGAV